ncbi:hypothetical protein BGW38_005999 [Lunasporangiospora selenospora]|uniref:Sucrase/ferredoxin-like-domain-containing protein n=1 Tax=Lunasporangiospora selenospora TaxID=979761 RepID=A0A9P6FP82_9FUNG|nr:hypothetical protein BGW38_005999 [Lunasporangiospora selenospora]
MNFMQGVLSKAIKLTSSSPDTNASTGSSSFFSRNTAEPDMSTAPFVSLESDCHYTCDSPCYDSDHDHPLYPRYLKINRDRSLQGSVKPYWRHVLISTGESDWDSHIDSDKSELAYHLVRAIDKAQSHDDPSPGRGWGEDHQDLSSGHVKDKDNKDLDKEKERVKDKDHKPRKSGKGKILVTNSSRKAENWEGPGWQVVILPDEIIVNNVTIEQCSDFYEAFLRPPIGSLFRKDTGSHLHAKQSSTTPPLGEESTVQKETESGKQLQQENVSNQVEIWPKKIKAGKTEFVAHPWLPQAAIMICSHKRRDKRCGITAPILHKEFKRLLRSKDIHGDGEGDVEIWNVSHIGGHKFAGNVIVHRGSSKGVGKEERDTLDEDPKMAVWYGRVEPSHCKTIVETTIERGEVIRELFRGAMHGSFDGIVGDGGHTKRARLAW